MASNTTSGAQESALRSVDDPGQHIKNEESTSTPASPSRQDGSKTSSPVPASLSHDEEHSSFISSSPSTNSKAENKLRPAADIINRIIWDDRYDSNDYLIGYEDRFEGRLEAGLGSWKRDLTDEEFIPQHRILYIMRKADKEVVWDRRRRIDKIFNSGNSACSHPAFHSLGRDPEKPSEMDLSLWRRRRNLSSSSGSGSSPVPNLQSPATYHASVTKDTSKEATIKQKKSEGVVAMPSMFLEDADDDDHVPCNLTRGTPTEAKPIHAAQASVEEEEEEVSTKKMISKYLKDTFGTRELDGSPKIKEGQDSAIVFEIQMNTKVNEDESQLASTISSRLAQIYGRSEQSVMVVIQQNACILFGSSPLPAYLMKVFALPSLIAPMTNRRNTILIQTALRELLDIAAERGVVIYVPVPGENLATNGTTAVGDSQHEPNPRGENAGILRSISRSVSRRLKSSSAQSAPLSMATTSSWTNPGETQEAPKTATGENVQTEEVSNTEEKPGGVKKSRSVRHFVSRRLSELGSLGDLQ